METVTMIIAIVLLLLVGYVAYTQFQLSNPATT